MILEGMVATFNCLIQKSTSAESLAYYNKGIGDCYRYLGATTGVDYYIAMELTNNAYKTAIVIAEDLPKLTLVRLGTHLNYCCFLSECRRDLKAAIAVAKKMSNEITESIIFEDDYALRKTATSVKQMFDDNIALWSTEINSKEIYVHK